MRSIVFACAAFVACLFPSVASAASVEKIGNELVYRSGDLASSLTVDWNDPYGDPPPRIEFTDLGNYPNAVITPGAGCDRGTRPGDAYYATCAIDGVTRIRLEGEGGNDSLVPSSSLPTTFRLTSNGGPGDDDVRDRSGVAAGSTLNGGPGDDGVLGYAGNDVLTGGPDDATDLGDSIDAGDGLDTVYGGGGDDRVYGDDFDDPAFADRILGQSGNDTIYAAYGDDKVYGGSGNDTLHGEGGADVLSGDGGSDVIEPDPTSSGVTLANYAGDVVYGGRGIDTVAYPYREQAMTYTLDGEANDGMLGEDDDIDADRSVENLQPGEGANDITLDDKDNELRQSRGDIGTFGPGGDDTIRALGGDDVIWTGTGEDVADGGAGDDRIADWGNHDVLIGGEGDDELIGNTTGDDFEPGPGQDAVFGNDGYDDVVSAADGEADAIHCGGDFDDDVAEADANDTLVACETAVVLDGTAAVVAGLLDLRATGGKANTLSVRPVAAGTYEVRDVVPVDAGAGCTQVSPNVVRCTGMRSVSIAAGDGNDDVTLGSGIAGTILGGPGADTLTGGSGANTIDGGAGGDTIAGGGGIDTVTYASRTEPVWVDLDGVRDDGNAVDAASLGARDNVQADVENITGGLGADKLYGSGLANVIDGGFGGDVIWGRGGIDTVTYASRATGVVVDADGVRDDGSSEDAPGVGSRDNVASDVENLIGGSGADTLIAVSPVANLLNGGAGNDRLKTRDGGATADQLVCGGGADTYDADPVDTRSLCETPAAL